MTSSSETPQNNTPFEILESSLSNPDPDYSMCYGTLATACKAAVGKDIGRVRPLLRLAGALRDGAGAYDILPLLRQAMRLHGAMNVHISQWDRWADHATSFGLSADGHGDQVQVVAHDWYPAWLQDTAQIDQLEQRRADATVIGDGSLYALSDGRFRTYHTTGQKRAVQAALFAETGQTLLITLPTGSGKSICITLPAYVASNGGRKAAGTTIVVVPTVALALDHAANAAAFFREAKPGYQPLALTGSTDLETQRIAFEGVEMGTCPILFVSPEKLLQGALYDVCLDAARNGRITRLVIDEAHLVETWGAGFRVEFQLLAAYRNKLLEASDGHISTLLLSATISASASKTLTELFTGTEDIIRVQADQLRPEISYWFSKASSANVRREYVLEALRHLPRPAIVYTTEVEHARDLHRALQEAGYTRTEQFTGDTRDNERERILNAWHCNAVDVVIATSAFGLGVDKADVRTIIHATVPETLDRFYQEVGRGGRDGLSSISLMIYTKRDLDTAQRMSVTGYITKEKAWSRWRAMSASAKPPNPDGVIVIDTRVRPSTAGRAGNDKDVEWNKHTLLLMQRAGWIEIVDSRGAASVDPTASHPDAREIRDLDRLPIRILDGTPLNNEIAFYDAFDAKRQRELRTLGDGFSALRTIVEGYTAKNLQMPCISQQFKQVYTEAVTACGGCPTCRAEARKPRGGSTEGQVTPYRVTPVTVPIDRCRIVIWSGPERRNYPRILAALGHFVREGAQQIVLPERWLDDAMWVEELLKTLWAVRSRRHLVFTDAELALLLPLPSVLIYPSDEAEADRLYRRWHSQFMDVPVVSVVRYNLHLASLNGRFVERVAGTKHDLEHYLEQKGEAAQ